jgi:hypothetical protein
MLKKLLPLLLISLIGMPSIAWGKAYIWTDDEGIQYATDNEAAIPEKYKDKVKIILDPIKHSHEPDELLEKTVVNFSRRNKSIIVPGVLNETYTF